jgi:hypothetical protein
MAQPPPDNPVLSTEKKRQALRELDARLSIKWTETIDRLSARDVEELYLALCAFPRPPQCIRRPRAIKL